MPFDDYAEPADDEPGIRGRGKDDWNPAAGEGEDDAPDLDDWDEDDYDDEDEDDVDDAGNAWDRTENPTPRRKRPCNIAPEIRLGETMPATTVLRQEWDKIRDLDSDLVERWTMRMGRPGQQPRAEVCGAPSTDFRSMVLAKALKGRIVADSVSRILDLAEGAIQRLDHGQVRSIADVFEAEKTSFIAVMRWAELLEEAFRAGPDFRAAEDASKKRQIRRRQFLRSTWPQITDLPDPGHLTPYDDEVQYVLRLVREEVSARVSLADVRSRLADAQLAERVQEALDAWTPFDHPDPGGNPTDPGQELRRALDDLADSPSWADVNRTFPALRDQVRKNRGAADALLASVARRAELADPVEESALCVRPGPPRCRAGCAHRRCHGRSRWGWSPGSGRPPGPRPRGGRARPVRR